MHAKFVPLIITTLSVTMHRFDFIIMDYVQKNGYEKNDQYDGHCWKRSKYHRPNEVVLVINFSQWLINTQLKCFFPSNIYFHHGINWSGRRRAKKKCPRKLSFLVTTSSFFLKWTSRYVYLESSIMYWIWRHHIDIVARKEATLIHLIYTLLLLTTG